VTKQAMAARKQPSDNNKTTWSSRFLRNRKMAMTIMKKPEMKYPNDQLVNAKVVMVLSPWKDVGN